MKGIRGKQRGRRKMRLRREEEFCLIPRAARHTLKRRSEERRGERDGEDA
jgi:hypothetical protein